MKWIKSLIAKFRRSGPASTATTSPKLTLTIKTEKTLMKPNIPLGKKRYSDIDWKKFVRIAHSLVGKPYKFGAEINLFDSNVDNIKALDCSELSEYMFAQIGLRLPDGSYNQIKHTYPIEYEKLRIGDLAFKWDPDTEVIHHVAVIIGDANVIEAKGKKWGVVLTSLNDYRASAHFASYGRHKEIWSNELV